MKSEFTVERKAEKNGRMKVRYDCATGGQFFTRIVCWLMGYHIMYDVMDNVRRQICGTCDATREKHWSEQ